MIRNFSDHAANERTFLAWVRTAIAVMAFGFLVEKFDLFLKIAAPSLGANVSPIRGTHSADIVGLALIVLGTLMVGLATWRFLKTAMDIDNPASRPGTGIRMDTALGALLVLLGVAMFLYLSHIITGHT